MSKPNKYEPHQGKRECERRLMQALRAAYKACTVGGTLVLNGKKIGRGTPA